MPVGASKSVALRQILPQERVEFGQGREFLARCALLAKASSGGSADVLHSCPHNTNQDIHSHLVTSNLVSHFRFVG
jgi:hypothetical protein